MAIKVHECFVISWAYDGVSAYDYSSIVNGFINHITIIIVNGIYK